MSKIVIAGAGGAPSEGVILSLQQNPENTVIGVGSEPTDLIYPKLIKNISFLMQIRRSIKKHC